jgi:CheY-like chemotaxis protein
MQPEHHGGPPARPDSAADILLVEDDAADAELAKRALSNSGLAPRVEHVTDGSEALEFISSTSLFVRKHAAPVPRLIMLDLKLHRMGGLHVLQRLKSDERTRGIPIVVLTGSRMAIEVLESYKLGVNSYVLKPTDAAGFAEVVAHIARYWLTINEPPPS